jgi:hypothetical protein
MGAWRASKTKPAGRLYRRTVLRTARGRDKHASESHLPEAFR